MALSDRVALLRHGKLEQIASPREIYSRPATSYTAQFIGDTNLMACSVASGIRGLGQNSWPSFGSRAGTATFSLRPEKIRLACRRPQATVRFRGNREATDLRGRDGASPDRMRQGDRIVRARVSSQYWACRSDRRMISNSTPPTPSASQGEAVMSMYSRGYKSAVSIPPLLWVSCAAFLPLFDVALLQLLESRRRSDDCSRLGSGELPAAHQNPMYVSVLLRSMKIAGSVTVLSLFWDIRSLIFFRFTRPSARAVLYQLVIIPALGELPRSRLRLENDSRKYRGHERPASVSSHHLRTGGLAPL